MFSETERSPLEGVSLSEKGLERAERGGRVLSHLPWGGCSPPPKVYGLNELPAPATRLGSHPQTSPSPTHTRTVTPSSPPTHTHSRTGGSSPLPTAISKDADLVSCVNESQPRRRQPS